MHKHKTNNLNPWIIMMVLGWFLLITGSFGYDNKWDEKINHQWKKFSTTPVNKNEFLSQIKQGAIVLEKKQAIAVDENTKQSMINTFKNEWVDFNPEMLNVAYTDIQEKTYFVFYEWYDRGCVFGVTDKNKKKQLSNGQMMEAAEAENKSYEAIDKKYCELALGITLPDKIVKQVAPEANSFEVVENSAQVQSPKKANPIDGTFGSAITLAFGIFAFMKWMDYLTQFKPEESLSGLIPPAVATFLTFKWSAILSWFNLF